MQTNVGQLEPGRREKIVKFMQAHPVGVLATVDSEGKPHASALYVNVDDKLDITFTTKVETRKYENLTRDNSLMLVVYDAMSQTVVQVSGKAVEITDQGLIYEIYNATLRSSEKTGADAVPPISKIVAGKFAGFRVEVENIWMTEYGSGDSFANAMQHAQDPAPSGDPS